MSLTTRLDERLKKSLLMTGPCYQDVSPTRRRHAEVVRMGGMLLKGDSGILTGAGRQSCFTGSNKVFGFHSEFAPSKIVLHLGPKSNASLQWT